jgi:hypothetical protein
MNPDTYVGPKCTIYSPLVELKDMSFVQEIVKGLTDLQYCMLEYTPADGWSLQITVNGRMLVRDVDYVVDVRKVKFTEPLLAANDKITAIYLTAGVVTPPDNPDIPYDVPSQNVRYTASGELQILNPDTGLWHKMVPSVHPITDDLDFVPDQDPV